MILKNRKNRMGCICSYTNETSDAHHLIFAQLAVSQSPQTFFHILPLNLKVTPLFQENWDIYSYHINSTVTSRYAVTVITSRVANRMEESKEIGFQVRIPKNAFITKFKMYVKGNS